jgi:hypothetical protein
MFVGYKCLADLDNLFFLFIPKLIADHASRKSFDPTHGWRDFG